MNKIINSRIMEDNETRLPIENWGELMMEDKVRETTKKIMAVVGTILYDYERSRNDDFVLAVEVWRRMNQVETTSGHTKEKEHIIHIKINSKEIPYIVPFETISRCRRKWNQKGKYLPTNEKVIKARMRKEKVLRRFF